MVIFSAFFMSTCFLGIKHQIFSVSYKAASGQTFILETDGFVRCPLGSAGLQTQNSLSGMFPVRVG